MMFILFYIIIQQYLFFDVFIYFKKGWGVNILMENFILKIRDLRPEKRE